MDIIFYYQILRHIQCIFVQKQDLKKRNGLIMHKQTWQHYTKVPEEKQSVVFLLQQFKHFTDSELTGKDDSEG